MRPLSLQSDLENEVWILMKELVEEHGKTIHEARSLMFSATNLNTREWIRDNETA